MKKEIQINEKPSKSGQTFLLGRKREREESWRALWGAYFTVLAMNCFASWVRVAIHAVLCVSNINNKKAQHCQLLTHG